MDTSVTFEVEGMHCAGCAGRVERALAVVPGVQSAQALLTRGAARVEGGDASALADALDTAGYPARQMRVTLSVEGLHCGSCVGRVERALTAVPGVLDARVNLATGTAQVTALAESARLAQLLRATREAGFPAKVRTSEGAESPSERAEAEAARLRRDMIRAAALTLPVFVLAMGAHMIPGMAGLIDATLTRQGSWLLQMVLTALVLAGPGRQFLRIGLPALARGAPEMNSLVALGTLSALGYSTVATLAPGLLPEGTRAVYFEAAAVICTLILLGRWLEARAKGRAGAAIARLMDLRPALAEVARDGAFIEIPAEEVLPGDLLRLRPGGRVPVDGEVTEGHSRLDESLLTGEPLPVSKSPGDPLTSGTINTTGALTFRATRVGADTTLAQIIALVDDAQATRLPVQSLVDRITRWFVPAVMVCAALAFLGWLLFGPSLAHAVVAGVSVLIVACPCAMGLAVPVSILVGTGRAAELGVLFRRGEALQELAGVETVAFDKTGTLTEGAPALTLRPDPALLRAVAALEARSEHPVARAIAEAAEAPLPEVTGFESHPGGGVSGTVEGAALIVGNARLLRTKGIDPTPLEAQAEALAQQGATPVFVARDGGLAGLLAVSDPLKATAPEAVATLRSSGLGIALVTGDLAPTARHVAERLGIWSVTAGVLPAGKQEALSAYGPNTAFVGDGINDAPALAQADVGIALGTGTEVAIESADVVLMSGDPRGVAVAHRISRAVMRNIRQNLGWAFGYNVLLIPLAAGVFAPLTGWQLSPMLAAGAMALSSVCVLTNALRLRRA